MSNWRVFHCEWPGFWLADIRVFLVYVLVCWNWLFVLVSWVFRLQFVIRLSSVNTIKELKLEWLLTNLHHFLLCLVTNQEAIFFQHRDSP